MLGSLALLSFGVADLVVLLPFGNKLSRLMAATSAVLVVPGIAALAGMRPGAVALTMIIAVPAVIWVLSASSSPRGKDAWQLLLPVVAVVGTTAAGSAAADVGGDLASWYEGLPLEFAGSGAVSVGQFLFGVAAFFFLLATSNRVVKLVLATTDAQNLNQDELPRGGRLLGPMERLIVAATVVAGDPAAAGLVIAAKGLLRFPEVNSAGGTNVRELTEYLLVGTFTSISIAGILAVLLLANS